MFIIQQCILCGACAVNYPTGAMRVEDRGEERLLLTCCTILSRQPLVRCEIWVEPLGTQRQLNDVAAQTGEANAAIVQSMGCPVCARTVWSGTVPDRLAFQRSSPYYLCNIKSRPLLGCFQRLYRHG